LNPSKYKTYLKSKSSVQRDKKKLTNKVPKLQSESNILAKINLEKSYTSYDKVFEVAMINSIIFLIVKLIKIIYTAFIKLFILPNLITYYNIIIIFRVQFLPIKVNLK